MNQLSQQDKQTLDQYSGMSVGDIFRKTREKHGYDLSQLVEHLNIGTDHLLAIENNDEAHLPPKVYAVGFVRAYADALGLDAEKMVYLFKVQIYGKKQIEDQKKVIKSDGKTLGLLDVLSSKKEAIFVILAFLILLGLIISALWFLVLWAMTSSDDRDMSVPPVPADMLASSNNNFIPVEEDVEQASEPMDILIRPSEGRQSYGVDALQAALTLKIIQDISAEIRNVRDGTIVVSDILRAGDVVYIAEGQDVLVSATNGAAIEVYLDGQNLGLLGQQGQEVRLRALSVEALRLINAP